MKLIFLSLLFLFVGCNDSPSPGGGAPIAEEQSESRDRSEIEDVVSDLDEGELNKINDAFMSLSESVEIENEIEIDSQYRIQKTKVFSTSFGPVTYLFNYHSEGTKIFKLNIDTQKYEVFLSKSKLRIHSVINHEKDVYFLTKKPVRIFKLSPDKNSVITLKNPFSDDKAKLLRASQSNGQLFLRGDNEQIFTLDLVSNESRLHRGKGNIVQILGNSEVILYKLLEEKNTQSIKSSMESTPL